MNQWIGDGRLVRDPELEVSQTGSEFCRFTIANDRKPDKDGNKQTDFISCAAFGKTAVFVQKFFHKGDGANIIGRLESYKYVDKDGNNRIDWGISVEQISFPLGRGKSSQTGTETAAPAPSGTTDSGFTDVSAEDLPF